jgi:hypothetical protein
MTKYFDKLLKIKCYFFATHHLGNSLFNVKKNLRRYHLNKLLSKSLKLNFLIIF